jgi:hypothetical protein
VSIVKNGTLLALSSTAFSSAMNVDGIIAKEVRDGRRTLDKKRKIRIKRRRQKRWHMKPIRQQWKLKMKEILRDPFGRTDQHSMQP